MGYKAICHRCNKKCLYVTPENGKSFCFACRYFHSSGKAIEKKRYTDIHALRNVYTEIADYYHACLGPKQRKYLENRGITDHTIQRMRIGYTPIGYDKRYTNPLAREAGLTVDGYSGWLADRIVFPYKGTDNTTWDIRGRILEQQEPRYLSLKGSAYYRGADCVYNLSAMQGDYYVLTEGEIKAIASQQVGVPCIAFPGMTSYRTVIERVDQRRIVCFDNQQDARYVHDAIIRLAQRIGTNIYVATLPLRGETKQDIDSYIHRYGAEAYREVIHNALPFEYWFQLIPHTSIGVVA